MLKKTAAEYLGEKQASAFMGTIDARTFPKEEPRQNTRTKRITGSIKTKARTGKSLSGMSAENRMKLAAGRLKNLSKWKQDYVQKGSAFTSPARAMTAELGPDHWLNSTPGQALRKLFRK